MLTANQSRLVKKIIFSFKKSKIDDKKDHIFEALTTY